MSKVLSAIAAVCLLSGSAFAADLPAKRTVPPAAPAAPQTYYEQPQFQAPPQQAYSAPVAPQPVAPQPVPVPRCAGAFAGGCGGQFAGGFGGGFGGCGAQFGAPVPMFSPVPFFPGRPFFGRGFGRGGFGLRARLF